MSEKVLRAGAETIAAGVRKTANGVADDMTGTEAEKAADVADGRQERRAHFRAIPGAEFLR